MKMLVDNALRPDRRDPRPDRRQALQTHHRPPAVVEPEIRELHFRPLPTAVIDEHSLNALEFHTAEPSGGAIPKMRTR